MKELENLYPYSKEIYKNKKSYIKYIEHLLNSMKYINIKNNIHKDFINFDCNITGITINEDNNRYFISINYKYIHPYQNNLTYKYLKDYIENKSNRMVGIDLGLKDKLIFNNGKKIKGIHSSKKFQKLENDKKTYQRKLSKRVEKQKKKILTKKYKNGYKSISPNDYKKLKKSRKKDKYKDIPKKIDLYQLLQENKITILKEDYKFSTKEWKKIYNHKEIRDLQKAIKRKELKQKHIKDNENHHISKNIVENFDFIFTEDLTIKGMQSLWGNKIKVL